MRSLRDSMIPLEEVRGHKLHAVRAKQSQRPLWLCDCSCGLWQGEASSLDWARARWHEHLIAWLFGEDRIEAGGAKPSLWHERGTLSSGSPPESPGGRKELVTHHRTRRPQRMTTTTALPTHCPECQAPLTRHTGEETHPDNTITRFDFLVCNRGGTKHPLFKVDNDR